jgi:hypothetical protein
MGNTLLSIIGSLIGVLLGLLLYLIKLTRSDIDKLEKHVDASIESMRKEIVEKVHKPDCLREMMDLKVDLKELVRDVRQIERGEK